MGSNFLSNFLESKILALCVLLLSLATIISVSCSMLPFWFTLNFSTQEASFGNQGNINGLHLEIGIFFLYKTDKPGDEPVLMTSLTHLDKVSNKQVVPRMFKGGQVLYAIGLFGTAACTAAAIILAFRKFGSLTGQLVLSAFSTVSAITLVLGCVLVVLSALGVDVDNTWRNMPVEVPFHRIILTTHPDIVTNWAFYIAVIGAGLALFGSIVLWIDTLKLCKTIEDIRMRQQQTPAPKEPYPDIRYTRFSYADVPRPAPEIRSHHHEGVVISTDPAPPVFIAAPQSYAMSNIPPKTYHQPQPSPQGYRPPPSPSSGSGYISRQVDL